jgi:hypothetical protein
VTFLTYFAVWFGLLGDGPAAIRHSGLSQFHRGPLLMLFIQKGMTKSQVRSIFGADAEPMEIGLGFDCVDYWYVNHGVIVSFQDHRVRRVTYQLPPHDEKGVILVGLD